MSFGASTWRRRAMVVCSAASSVLIRVEGRTGSRSRIMRRIWSSPAARRSLGLDGPAYLDEEVETLLRRKIVLIAIFGDLDAANQLHDKVGAAGFSGAGVQHFGDDGMVHHGQRLPFGFKAGDDLFGVHPELDDLE